MGAASRWPSRFRSRRWSVAARLYAVELACIALGAVIAIGILAVDARGRAADDAAERSTAVARSVADNPFVIAEVQQPHPSTELQPYAVRIMADTGVDFVTIMGTDRVRYTHRDPAEIGKKFIGTIAPALQGKTFTETYTGTLGPSVRAVTPIRDDGRIVALVSAGVTLQDIDSTFWVRVSSVAVIGLALALIAALVTGLLMLYLRRVTRGRDPRELGQVFASYETVLHTVREGLLLVDAGGRITVANDHALELLGLSGLRLPVPIDEVPVSPALAEVLRAGEAAERFLVMGDRVLVAASRPAEGRAGGTVITLRDRTELQRLAGDLESMRTMGDALRSQTHEYANRLHTIVSLLELGRPDEALAFAADELGISQRLADRVVGSVDEPVIAALMLGKAAQARARGLQLELETHLEPGTQGLEPEALVSILGNLIDNAMDAAAETATPESPGWVEVYLGLDEGDLVVQVSDSGAGLADTEAAFTRGWSTKPAGAEGRGLGLAIVRDRVRRLGGTIEVAQHVGAVFTVQLPLPGRDPAVARSGAGS